MTYCSECGAENAREAKFCDNCGSILAHVDSTVAYAPTFTEEELPPVTESPAAAALIELDQVEGTAGRRMHDVGEEVITVGRSPERSIFLDDVTVSREHAEIQPGGQGFRIRDAGSLNGTYVNRVRVDAVDLRNGDEIQIGKYRFKFVFT